jgi:hypothetical protein
MRNSPKGAMTCLLGPGPGREVEEWREASERRQVVRQAVQGDKEGVVIGPRGGRRGGEGPIERQSLGHGTRHHHTAAESLELRQARAEAIIARALEHQGRAQIGPVRVGQLLERLQEDLIGTKTFIRMIGSFGSVSHIPDSTIPPRCC